VVEALSIDEAFLDVRGLEHISGTPAEIAARLRRDVREQVGLPITVGIARTKFLAKVASRVAKPDGLLVVCPEAELEFLHPLPVEYLWGVGRVTAAKLHRAGISTVAEVAATEEALLIALLGPASGRHLHALSHNRDTRPVRRRSRRRSVGAQRALGRRQHSAEEIATALTGLVDRVTRRLRAARRVCRTIVLRLRFSDYTRATRSSTMADPTSHTHTILTVALELLELSTPTIQRRGLTLVGIALTNLSDQGAVQLALPFDRSRELDAAVDKIRDRFGSSAINRATLIGRDPGVWVPLLPD
jgi:DNA polymerase IV